jgi:tetratricopeptide (TPR) repeat protein
MTRSMIALVALLAALLAACKPPEIPMLIQPDPQPLFDQTVQLLRAKRPAEAIVPLKQALAMADKMRGEKRIRALSRSGELLWSLRETSLAETTLLTAAKEIDATPGAVTPDISARTFRMLGVVYRDLNRPAEAIPWLERAITADRGLPEKTAQEMGLKQMALASNIQELASQQCRAGQGSLAEETDKQRMQVCAAMRNPKSVGACNETPRACTRGGWMRGEKQVW